MGSIFICSAIALLFMVANSFPNMNRVPLKPDANNIWLPFINSIPGKYDDFQKLRHLNVIKPKVFTNDSVFVEKQTNLIQLAKNLNLTTLVDKLKDAGMDDVLDHEGKFTLFAPTNEAFARRPKYCDNVQFVNLMKYHVARGSYLSRDFKDDFLMPTMVRRRDIRINIYNRGKTKTANGRVIIKPDQIASNGVLHVLDDVMCAFYIGSAIKEINRCPAFTILSKAVNLTNMYITLDAVGAFTVFAPTDEAFEKLDPKILASLYRNLTAFKEVLMLHVVHNVWYTAGMQNGTQLQTFQGDILRVCHSGSTFSVNSAVVTLPDATVRNGVVHSIDKVLLPKSLKWSLLNN